MIIEQLKFHFTQEQSELDNITKKIIHKIENRETDPYFSPKDYFLLLEYYLSVNDENKVMILMSSALINILKVEIYFKFEEENNLNQLKEVQLNLLIKSIKNNDTSSIKYIVPFLKPILNKPLSLFETREMTPGATFLHLCLKSGNIEAAKFLIENGADCNSLDYYLNSTLHYAAMGNEAIYHYMRQVSGLRGKNIFGHDPEYYLTNKDNLPFINQRVLIEQFTLYMQLNGYDKNSLMINEKGVEIPGSKLIEEINIGFCKGDGFIKAIQILRGEDSSQLHEKMVAAIRGWKGTEEELDRKIEDPELLKEFSNLSQPNLRAIFEYLMSIIVISQGQKSIPFLDNRGCRLLYTLTDPSASSYQTIKNACKNAANSFNYIDVLEDRDIFIIYKDCMFYAETRTKTVNEIKISKEKQKDFEKLRNYYQDERADNYIIPDEEEIKLIQSLTGFTYILKHYAAIFDFIKQDENEKLIKDKESQNIDSIEDFKEKIKKIIANPNRFIAISLGDNTKHKYGHVVFVVTNNDKSLYFIDPNARYKIPALENNSESLSLIANLCYYPYFNNVIELTSYDYSPVNRLINNMAL